MNPHASRVDIVAINTNPQLVIWLAQFHHTLWRLGFLSPRGPRRQGRTQCVGGSGSGTRGAGGPANQVHQDVVVVEAQQVQDHVHCECVSTRQCNHQLQSCKVLHSIFGLLTRGLFQSKLVIGFAAMSEPRCRPGRSQQTRRTRGLSSTIQTQDNRKRQVKDDIAGHKDGRGRNLKQKTDKERLQENRCYSCKTD